MEKREISLFDFNKELLFGELGALIGAPVLASIGPKIPFLKMVVSYLSKFIGFGSIVSLLAVIGSILGAAVFWLLIRIFDEKKMEIFSLKHFAKEIRYFTPAAFLLTLLVYYPSLFLISRHLLTQDYRVASSVILSQIVAFSLFLTSINAYRYFLWEIAGKRI